MVVSFCVAPGSERAKSAGGSGRCSYLNYICRRKVPATSSYIFPKADRFLSSARITKRDLPLSCSNIVPPPRPPLSFLPGNSLRSSHCPPSPASHGLSRPPGHAHTTPRKTAFRFIFINGNCPPFIHHSFTSVQSERSSVSNSFAAGPEEVGF